MMAKLGLRKNGRVIVAGLVLALLLVLVGSETTLTVTATDLPYTLTNPITKKVKFTLIRTNVGTETLSNVHIYVGVPVSMPEQEIISLSWEPRPTRYVYDLFGQKIADFSIGTLRPGQQVTIRFTAIGKFWRIKYNVDPDKVGSLDDIPREVINLYTIDGPKYKITDPFIVNTAHKVIKGETNPYRMAVLIHDFVAKNVRYEIGGGWDDAVTVLKRGSGTCSEFTFAFIALARAVGLPARYAGGSIYMPSEAIGGHFIDKAGHRWPEVYIPNYGWTPFDPTGDRARSGRPVSHKYVGSHGYGLVMVCGGGTDERYLGIMYRDIAHWHGSSKLKREWHAVWSNP